MLTPDSAITVCNNTVPNLSSFMIKLARHFLVHQSISAKHKIIRLILILSLVKVYITLVINYIVITKMSGFKIASVDLKHISAKLICKQCDCVLRDPLQTPCAHFYCRTCLKFLKSGTRYKCKVDDEEFSQSEVFPDGCVRKEIQQLEVHCLNHEGGCEWKGKLEDLEEHAIVCDFTKIACVFKQCGQKIIKSKLAEHLEQECSQRQVKCDLCSDEMPQAELEDHKKKACRRFLIKCSLCNKKDIPREELRHHHDPTIGDCEESLAACAFSTLGCSSKKEMKREERKKHDDRLLPFHLNLLVRFVFTLRDQLGYYVQEISPIREGLGVIERLQHMVTHVVSQVATVARDTANMRDDIKGIKSRLTSVEQWSVVADSMPASHSSLLEQCQRMNSLFPDVKRRLNNMEANMANYDLLMVESNRTIDEHNNDIVWLKRQVENFKESLRRLQEKLDTQSHRSPLPPVDLRNSTSGYEVNSYDGVLIWRITSVAAKIYDAVNSAENSFYSPPFYTSRHGYKMRARIYLNGDGMGKGTHISLFFVIMRGEYDALLRWPFRQKVTMMLLDQNNIEHVIDAFRPDPNSSSFQRPRREMNVASGCPLFFPLADMNNHAYMKDDVMFIKIIVDCLDL